MEKLFYVYILASKRNGTLYIGITTDLQRRIWHHKQKFISGFTAKYNVNKLVYYEVIQDAEVAISREKRLKYWRRQWKIALIEKHNPRWDDLFYSLIY